MKYLSRQQFRSYDQTEPSIDTSTVMNAAAASSIFYKPINYFINRSVQISGNKFNPIYVTIITKLSALLKDSL